MLPFSLEDWRKNKRPSKRRDRNLIQRGKKNREGLSRSNENGGKANVDPRVCLSPIKTATTTTTTETTSDGVASISLFSLFSLSASSELRFTFFRIVERGPP